jgi:hypothetical protein
MALVGCLVAASLVLGFVTFAARAKEQLKANELNAAKSLEGECRRSYLANNGAGILLEKGSFKVITFNADGSIVQSLVFECG